MSTINDIQGFYENDRKLKRKRERKKDSGRKRKRKLELKNEKGEKREL